MPNMTDRDWDFALLGDRVAYVLQHTGLGPEQLAAKIGVRRPAVDQRLTGSTKNLRMKNLFRLADVSGFSARWLATAEGPPRDVSPTDAQEFALIDHYRHSDDRGRRTILRVAEEESHYAAPPAPPSEEGFDPSH